MTVGGIAQLARSRNVQSRSRARRGDTDRSARLIYSGTAATLVAAALIVTLGVYLTRFRPPRAHVATIDGRTIAAAEVVRRGAYMALFEGRATGVEALARDTVALMIDEAILRARGPALGGEVTATDVERELYRQLGLVPPPEIAATPTPTPRADATPAPAPAPTPDPAFGATSVAPTPSITPTPREAFASGYRRLLQRFGLSRAEFEEIVRAQLLRRRLEAHFRESTGTRGPQVQLSRLRVNDFALAEVIRQQLRDGADFAKLQAEHAVERDEKARELAWQPPALLADPVQEAVRGLQQGEISEVVKQGINFDIFRVSGLENDREYDDATRRRLVDQQVRQWLDLERERVDLREDLSGGEQRWITEQILERAEELRSRAVAGR